MPELSTIVPASSPARPAPEVDEVVRYIASIADEQLELSGKVTAQARLVEDLALDSLGLTVVAVELENRYRIRLSEQDADGIRTVEELARLVARRVTEQGGE